MPIEIEKKYRLDRELFEELAARLESVGALSEGRRFERNVLYSNALLVNSNALIRLRTVDGQTTLTHKKNISVAGGIKSQVELETLVEDGAAIESILGELGINKTVVYEKWRSVWQLLEAEIVLDELPFGLFMEIEGSVHAIAAVEEAIGARDIECVGETYPSLTIKHGIEREGVLEALFADAGTGRHGDAGKGKRQKEKGKRER